VAVISLGGMVVSRSLRVGGYEFDDAIIGHLRREHHIAVGQPTAEQLKLDVGSAWPLEDELTTEVRGRDVVTGLPKELVLTSEEVRGTLAEPLAEIVLAVRETLEETPPELAADIAEHGITLAGGGSLLRGIDALLHEETGMDARLADSPLTCVAEGAGYSLEEFDALAAGTGARRRLVSRLRS
jgi:rod shape-determining protein MreB